MGFNEQQDKETYDKVVLKVFEAINDISVDNIDEKVVLTELQMNIFKFLKDYYEYQENKRVLNQHIRRK